MFSFRGTILVIAPHTDDEVIGCGGTIAKALDAGNLVFVTSLSPAYEAIPNGWPLIATELEFKEAMKELGVTNYDFKYFPLRRFDTCRQEILDYFISLRSLRPAVVLVPAFSDEHQDHEVVRSEARRAFWDTTLLGYEITKRSVQFRPQCYVPLSVEDIMRKERAVGCYTSQQIKKNFSGAPDVIRAIARIRGLQVGVQYAEAFEVLRSVILSL